VCATRSNGTECPACLKVLNLQVYVCHLVCLLFIMLQSGRSKRILSINGNFGLCRKKVAGQSVRAPLHEGVFFKPQYRVDAFVELYKMLKSSSNKVHGRSDSVNFINLLLTFL